MKTLENLNAENPPLLAHATTLADLPEDMPALLKSKVVQVKMPLNFESYRLKIELQVIAGSDAVVWTGPKTMLPRRTHFLCLRRKHLVPLLLTGAMVKWKWSENQVSPALIKTCINFVNNIPSVPDVPDLAAEKTPEPVGLEHELNLV